MALSARLKPGQADAAFSDFYRFAEQRMEKAALIATDRAAREGLRDVRTAMQAAGLGRLGNAIGANSDLSRGRGVHRTANGGFSASGAIFIRSRSERTRGAIEAYTQGATILPRKSRFLWIPSDENPRLAGSNFRGKGQRLTPAMWVKRGFDKKIGPLVLIKSVNGYPLLIVRNVGVSLAGKSRSARSLTKTGRPRKGQMAKEFVVAFIGIPHTSRAARVDIPSILRVVQGQIENYFYEALGPV